jgi:hypothetical protein
VDQSLLDIDDGAGAAFVTDLLAVAEQGVVEDRVVAQAGDAVAVDVDQVEGAEPDVEAEGLGLGVGRRGRGVAPAMATPPSRNSRARVVLMRVIRRIRPP